MDEQKTGIKITDIRCPSCGAPASFDIMHQEYRCGYCGEKVGISEAKIQTTGFRKFQRDRMKNAVRSFRMASASCTGCGSTVVFEENEAVSNCAFCGRSLVRKEYTGLRDLPENLIPFSITEEEAKDQLRDWCRKNRSKTEARHLSDAIDELQGVYLPYELIRGPVHMTVSRMDGGKNYRCEGFINDEFVNRSKQLDNLLLDGMEPFNLDSLSEFDFAFVAGHRVKTPDITDKDLEIRAREEAVSVYTPAVRRTMETNAVNISTDVSSVMRLPVLLPVYYICKGNLMAAVNGQTGKVSVRAEKESHYFFAPWWLKAILATGIISLAVYAGLRLFGMQNEGSLMITAMTALYMLIVTLCLYSDTTKNRFSVEAGREIFTSGEKSFHRERGKLVQDEKIISRKVEEPVYFEILDGKATPVFLKFTTPVRILRMILLCTTALFLPVIIALFLNGFQVSKLNLGGSAVWFCIMVPVVPIYLLKFGIVELYERPWIYTLSDAGKRKRYRKKFSLHIDRDTLVTVLRVVFVPPVSLAVWFGILSFCAICYLTAFG